MSAFHYIYALPHNLLGGVTGLQVGWQVVGEPMKNLFERGNNQKGGFS